MDVKKIPPVAWIAGGVLVVVIVGLFGATFVSMQKRSDAEMCAANLMILYTHIRSGEHPDSPKWNDAGAGREFLANYERWPTHERRPLDLNCPVKGRSREIDYRGPARPLPQMRADEPILADRPGNHGPGMGGNVVLKTGAMRPCAETDALWTAAASSTSD
jgi:hypothetical protein